MLLGNILAYLPGIPASGSTDANAFWLSFWAALYSGILYSIVTGLIVGLVVWKVQIISDNRRSRNSFEREFAVFKEHLRLAIKKPDVVNIMSAVSSIPPSSESVIYLLKNHPIDLWRQNLTIHKKFLDLLKEFQLVYFELRNSAENVDAKLRLFYREYNASKGMIGSNDYADISFFLGKKLNHKSEDILPWLDLSIKALGRLEESFDAATNDPKVVEPAKVFLENRNRLLSLVKAVEAELV